MARQMVMVLESFTLLGKEAPVVGSVALLSNVRGAKAHGPVPGAR